MLSRMLRPEDSMLITFLLETLKLTNPKKVEEEPIEHMVESIGINFFFKFKFKLKTTENN